MEQHKGLQSLVAKDAMTLLHNMVAMPWPGTHTCQDGQECQYCGFCVFWYQLALEIVEKLAPKASAIPPDVSKRKYSIIFIHCNVIKISKVNPNENF